MHIGHRAVVAGLIVTGGTLLLSAPTATRPELVRAAINARLAENGAPYRLHAVELGWRGQKQHQPSPHDFVPADPRRGGRIDITWTRDEVDLTADVPPASALGALGDALLPFIAQPCADGLTLIEVTQQTAVDYGELEAMLFQTTSHPQSADLTHAGWLPGSFFDHFGTDGASSILALTATFVFTDAHGLPTDIDANGAFDVSHRETYFNDDFAWDDSGLGLGPDIRTVALHETSHLLGIDELGATVLATADPDLLRPYAKTLYAGIEHELRGSTRSAFCRNWRHWPDR